MKDCIEFFVSGKPITQGSMTSFGKNRMVHQNHAKLYAWRKNISDQFQSQVLDRGAGWNPELRYFVSIQFYFDSPKKPANPYPREDLDKLIRAVLDALTPFAWDNDNQVVGLTECNKEYCGSGISGGVQGAYISITAF
jgi:Holliday junction resolvase RusA-like endonuclease